jgi:hypothetical protein
MSADYAKCSRCGELFCINYQYVKCNACGEIWCSYECAEQDGYDGNDCGYCREEIMTEWALLNFALKLLNMEKDELIAMYKNKK